MKLSFDIESIFHQQGNLKDYNPTSTLNYILEFLERKKIKAIFYIVSDYAKIYPEMVISIRDGGHEIGSHSKSHMNLSIASLKDLVNEVVDSKKVLESIADVPVNKFRAPEFKIPIDQEKYFQILLDAGYLNDSSCVDFDCNKSDYLFKNKLLISYIKPSFNFFGRPILSGGKFSRVIPFPINKYLSKNAKELYFHLHDFDTNVSLNKVKKINKSFISILAGWNSRKYMEEML